MKRKTLLVDPELCYGCFTCEVACKQEHNYSEGMCGIRVDELVTVSPDKVQVDFVPVTTRFCDLCADRLKRGESTTACVKHCQALCMWYGPVSKLVKMMEDKPRSSIFAPR